ncbi:ATP synthase subunit I [Melaminivora sp.]|jgi:ATP synthase protein I
MKPVGVQGIAGAQTEAEVEEDDFKPLSAQEAAQWRKRNPMLSPWRIVAVQALATLVVTLLAWWWGGMHAAWSAGYGGLAVVLPAVLLARAMRRPRNSAAAAMAALMGWELVKMALAVAMLAAAPRLVPGLSWLALLVGMVVVMKTYWIALLARSGVRKTV